MHVGHNTGTAPSRDAARSGGGTKDRRLALARLMPEARRGKVDVIAVWRLDRFGRSLAHVVTTICYRAAVAQSGE
jgi:DNA invertase Pin-like site-specific DNA recombinase